MTEIVDDANISVSNTLENKSRCETQVTNETSCGTVPFTKALPEGYHGVWTWADPSLLWYLGDQLLV